MDKTTIILKMNNLLEIMESYSNRILMDEDGNRLSIKKMPGLSIEKLQEFETSNSIALPQDLKDLLLLSNGISIFGIQIQSLEEMEFFEDELLLIFHNWGNGDFDCISVNQVDRYGMVFFMDHSIANLKSMDIFFSDWVNLAIKEIEKKGAMLHPMDYLNRNEEGMYKNIFVKLNRDNAD